LKNKPIVKGLLPTEKIKIEDDIAIELIKLGYYGFRDDV
jgi:hypothetical protein